MFRLSRFGWMLSLILALWVVAAQAHEFRYRYFSLDHAELPAGFVLFDVERMDDRGRIYGEAYECATIACDQIVPHVAVYKDGVVTVQAKQLSLVGAVNNRGVIGGGVFDPINFISQAALFRGDQVDLIPSQPGELSSLVNKLNDRGTAVVESDDALGRRTYLLYREGQTKPLDFGPMVSRPFVAGMNNHDLISGTEGPSGAQRGFRLNPLTGQAKLLNPLSTDPNAWGLGIDERGNVLGYSFFFGGLERIGVWNHEGTFKTYFVEGTPEFPTVSNSLLFNDQGLIVITLVSSPASERLKTSYLVPEPGVRLNLADLVENLPPGLNLGFILDINNRGDMIGLDFFGGGTFLLKRVSNEDHESSATTQSGLAMGERQGIRAAAAAKLQAIQRLRLRPLKGDFDGPQDGLESLPGLR